ncbi:MAG: OmpA family protein [Candidatus Omnitrophica bacterium]|nr:OmpA family protein [Candidatus Omnitrophota bacterium]
MNKKGLLLLVIYVFVLNGCAIVFQKGRRSDLEKIQVLKSELQELKSTQQLLEKRLSGEIKDKQVRLEMAEKGLVITFVAEVLFDSGKAKLRKESLPILDKVIKILKSEVPDNDIGIEGHTDNEPIKFSRWKTNWELSAQRALGVLYYLEEEGINPLRLSAIGYGEYKLVASNDTPEGRQTNRRVEIVILPKVVKKADPLGSQLEEEELK